MPPSIKPPSWKYAKIFVFTLKEYVEDFISKHLLDLLIALIKILPKRMNEFPKNELFFLPENITMQPKIWDSRKISNRFWIIKAFKCRERIMCVYIILTHKQQSHRRWKGHEGKNLTVVNFYKIYVKFFYWKSAPVMQGMLQKRAKIDVLQLLKL